MDDITYKMRPDDLVENTSTIIQPMPIFLDNESRCRTIANTKVAATPDRAANIYAPTSPEV